MNDQFQIFQLACGQFIEAYDNRASDETDLNSKKGDLQRHYELSKPIETMQELEIWRKRKIQLEEKVMQYETRLQAYEQTKKKVLEVCPENDVPFLVKFADGFGFIVKVHQGHITFFPQHNMAASVTVS